MKVLGVYFSPPMGGEVFDRPHRDKQDGRGWPGRGGAAGEDAAVAFDGAAQVGGADHPPARRTYSGQRLFENLSLRGLPLETAPGLGPGEDGDQEDHIPRDQESDQT
ncbi:hypothetical protein MUNTM_23830 [Mycobacterium sp. MUNTM1]